MNRPAYPEAQSLVRQSPRLSSCYRRRIGSRAFRRASTLDGEPYAVLYFIRPIIDHYLKEQYHGNVHQFGAIHR